MSVAAQKSGGTDARRAFTWMAALLMTVLVVPTEQTGGEARGRSVGVSSQQDAGVHDHERDGGSC